MYALTDIIEIQEYNLSITLGFWLYMAQSCVIVTCINKFYTPENQKTYMNCCLSVCYLYEYNTVSNAPRNVFCAFHGKSVIPISIINLFLFCLYTNENVRLLRTLLRVLEIKWRPLKIPVSVRFWASFLATTVSSVVVE